MAADVIKDIPKTQYVMINNFIIDVSIREDHSFTAEVTDYPTESGSSFSDNIRKLPIQVTMEGLVSNSPIGPVALYRRSEGEQFAFGQLGTPTGLGQASAEEAYAVLLAVWNRREPVTIRTSLATFERMALTSLSIPREAATGAALYFTATFQQVEVVTNERIVRKRTSARNGAGKRGRGSLLSDKQRRPYHIWRKGRDARDTIYVGGGNWYGEIEYLEVKRIKGELEFFHVVNVPTTGGPYANAEDLEIVTDHEGNIVEAINLRGQRLIGIAKDSDEYRQLQLDHKRDLRRLSTGQSLLDRRGVFNRGGLIFDLFGQETDIEKATRKQAAADLSKRNAYIKKFSNPGFGPGAR